MAITIIDSPHTLTPLYQKLMYVVSSGNVANTGFVFQFEIGIGGDTHTFLVPPNAANRGMFDVYHAIHGYFSPLLTPQDTANNSIHDLGVSDTVLHKYEDPATSTWIREVDVTIKEGWIIAGVFTPTAVGQATDTIIVWPARFFDDYGYKTSPESFENIILSDNLTLYNYGRAPRKKKFGHLYGQGFTDSSIKIPVYSTSRGIISFHLDDGTYSVGSTVAKVRMTIYASDGTPTTATYNLTDGAGRMCHFGCYPLNLDQTAYVGFLKPSDYPNYRAYLIELLDAGNNAMGGPFLFVPVDGYSDGLDCGIDTAPITVAWINSSGAWDYFDFPKAYWHSYDIDRKRFTAVRGTYNDTTFNYASYDRGTTEAHINKEMVLNCTSDWLDEGEFILLGEMVKSRWVYVLGAWTGSYSALTPVVIDRNNWSDEYHNTPNVKKLEIQFKVANRQW